MIRLSIVLAVLAFPTTLWGQAVPHPQSGNPRIQSVASGDGQVILLTTLPETAMTVALDRSEVIEEVIVGDRSAIAARVTAERNGFQLLPQRTGELGGIDVITNQRDYHFTVSTGTGPLAAYLVEVQPEMSQLPRGASSQELPQTGGETWNYRLRGDREVRPARIFDDGVRTQIEFAPDAPLPAIFAIGPSGDEQVVNGYMRGDVFVIDRVWGKLVFRIDREKATATRRDAPEQGDG